MGRKPSNYGLIYNDVSSQLNFKYKFMYSSEDL